LLSFVESPHAGNVLTVNIKVTKNANNKLLFNKATSKI